MRTNGFSNGAFTWALLLTGLLCFSAAHAHVSLQLEVQTHVEPKPGNQNAPKDSTVTWDVVLADKAFLVKSDKESNFFDFGKRQRVILDNRSKTQVDYSLYDTVGFRFYALQNREATVDSEHQLAIQAKPSSPLQTKVSAGEEVFLNGSAEYFRHSLQATAVSAADAKMFAQFFRYMFGGHPQILQALATSKGIAAQLVLTTYDVAGVITRKMLVKSVVQSPKKTLDVPRLPVRQAAAATDPLDKLLDRAQALTPADLAAARQRAQDDLAAALREGRSVDAYLGIIESSLMTGEHPQVLTDAQKASLGANETVGKLGTALTARTKDDLANAIKTFDEVLASGTQKAYVVKIFQANDKAMLGDGLAAQKLFMEVLNTNPALAGVYKDLGDVQFKGFDMPRAWRSWDLGRRMAPQFPNFTPVNQLERTLATEHPEFF